MSGNILVTCSTGGLGQLVIQALLDKKVPPKTIFAETRDPKKPAAITFQTKGITVRKADFTDPPTLTTAMAGIQTLLFISSGTLDKRVEQHMNVLNAAKASGTIKHIVYTSILHCSLDSKYNLTVDHFKTEEALKKIGIYHTIFRNSYYMELLPYMLGDALTSGKWNYPAGNAKVNFVAKSDIAEGLAIVLKDLKDHLNMTYEIASGNSYTFTQMAPIMAAASGKPIQYSTITMDQYKMVLKKKGLNDYDVNHLASAAAAVGAGQLDCDIKALDRILDRHTKTLEEFLPTVFKK